MAFVFECCNRKIQNSKLTLFFSVLSSLLREWSEVTLSWRMSLSFIISFITFSFSWTASCLERILSSLLLEIKKKITCKKIWLNLKGTRMLCLWLLSLQLPQHSATRTKPIVSVLTLPHPPIVLKRYRWLECFRVWVCFLSLFCLASETKARTHL